MKAIERDWCLVYVVEPGNISVGLILALSSKISPNLGVLSKIQNGVQTASVYVGSLEQKVKTKHAKHIVELRYIIYGQH